MSFNCRTLLLAFAGCLLLASPAASEERIAMIFGHGVYKHYPDTQPPDLERVKESLKKSGYRILDAGVGTKGGMRWALDLFRQKLRQAGNGSIGLLYFAGHTASVGGVNFLVPASARIETVQDLKELGLTLEEIMAIFQATSRSEELVVLDVCRERPFLKGSQALAEGFTEMAAPEGTLLALCTGPGEPPGGSDMPSDLYTNAFLDLLERPSTRIDDEFNWLRETVDTATAGRQTPWFSNALTRQIALSDHASADPHPGARWKVIEEEKASKAAPPPAPPEKKLEKAPPTAEDTALWNVAAKADSEAAYRIYLDQFPDGGYADTARKRISHIELSKQKAAAQPTPADKAPSEQPAPPAPVVATAEPSNEGTSAKKKEEKPTGKVLTAFMRGTGARGWGGSLGQFCGPDTVYKLRLSEDKGVLTAQITDTTQNKTFPLRVRRANTAQKPLILSGAIESKYDGRIDIAIRSDESPGGRVAINLPRSGIGSCAKGTLK